MVPDLVGTEQISRRKESSWNSTVMLRVGICNWWMKNHKHIEMITEAGTVNPESSKVNIYWKETQMNEAMHKE